MKSGPVVSHSPSVSPPLHKLARPPMEEPGNLTKVFVTSAAGTFGSACVRHLSTNLPTTRVIGSVREMSKSRDKFLDLRGNNFELVDVVGDRGLESLTRGMRGSDAVVIIPPNQRRVDVGKEYVMAAKNAGVRFICLLSVSAIGKREVMIARQFAELEDFIKETGIDACFLRATFFAENLLANAASFKRGSFYHPANPDARFNPISAADVAAFATAAIQRNFMEKKGHRGALSSAPVRADIYYLTGPGAVSMVEVAEILSKVASLLLLLLFLST